MEKLSFETLLFEEKGDFVEVTFLNIFSFQIPRERLEKIGKFKTEKNSILFEAENARPKFNLILDEGLLNLTNKITGKKTVYVHKNSGIPLVGSIAFGLIDRGTNVIEVRPISGCNIKCVYCSVDEDQRNVDFVVDADYLVEEFKKIVEFKGVDGIEAHIASQGEPTMYADIARLVAGIKKIPQVSIISIDTNGTLLTKSKIDELIKAGLNRINFSINAIDEAVAKKIAGVSEGYNIKKIFETAKYLSNKIELIIAPVYVPGINDGELEKIIEFTKCLKNKKFEPKCCIQNFLNYKFGRNPVKQKEFDDFFKMLKAFDDRHKLKLIIDKSDFNISKTKSLPKPFKEGNVVKAKIVCQGRLPNEFLAVAKDRVISVNLKVATPGFALSSTTERSRYARATFKSTWKNANAQVFIHRSSDTVAFDRAFFQVTNPQKQGVVDIKITGDKHNLFYGVVV